MATDQSSSPTSGAAFADRPPSSWSAKEASFVLAALRHMTRTLGEHVDADVDDDETADAANDLVLYRALADEVAALPARASAPPPPSS